MEGNTVAQTLTADQLGQIQTIQTQGAQAGGQQVQLQLQGQQLVQVGGGGQILAGGQPITLQVAGGQTGTTQLQQLAQTLQVVGSGGQVQQVCSSQMKLKSSELWNSLPELIKKIFNFLNF
ncbi:nuclear transcription factor Y subunit alpha-like [Lytechinus variegatus]|uniref:nuclear transcription factor Y subunit alpha-like n=1 Tax=Lytechinus variegatus TaxID=7654 RepID=UPI001BB0FC77|nr:nuclear transcription factor Y subunit alpha-like [Lytechinus variegatus]